MLFVGSNASICITEQVELGYIHLESDLTARVVEKQDADSPCNVSSVYAPNSRELNISNSASLPYIARWIRILWITNHNARRDSNGLNESAALTSVSEHVIAIILTTFLTDENNTGKTFKRYHHWMMYSLVFDRHREVVRRGL